MISTKQPKVFDPIYKVASCFIERDDSKILLVLRNPDKSEGNKWGAPAGKIQEGESPRQAIIREVLEETGIDISNRPMPLHKTYYIKYPDYDFIYHVFHSTVPLKTKITKSNERQALRWVSPEEALTLNLVRHFDRSIKDFYFS